MEWWLQWRERQLKRATKKYLDGLRDAQSQNSEIQTLQRLRASETRVLLGSTSNDEPVEVPIELLRNFSITTGSQGSGKTIFVLLLVLAMLRFDRPFGLVDAKGDLFDRALYLISQFPAVWNRVVIIDFNNREFVSPYNLLVPQGDD